MLEAGCEGCSKLGLREVVRNLGRHDRAGKPKEASHKRSAWRSAAADRDRRLDGGSQRLALTVQFFCSFIESRAQNGVDVPVYRRERSALWLLSGSLAFPRLARERASSGLGWRPGCIGANVAPETGQAEASGILVEKGAVDLVRRDGQHPPNVAGVLLPTPLAQELKLPQNDVFGRGQPDRDAGDPGPVRPGNLQFQHIRRRAVEFGRGEPCRELPGVRRRDQKGDVERCARFAKLDGGDRARNHVALDPAGFEWPGEELDEIRFGHG